MNKKIVFSGMSILASLALMSGATFAFFTSTVASTNNSFTSGTLVLSLNSITGNSSTGAFNVTGMAPGASVSRLITLKNEGSVDAAHVKVTGLNPTGDSGLLSKLTLVLFSDDNGNGDLDGAEATLGSGTLNDGTWAGFVLPSVTLPAGGTYKLGVKVSLASDADDTLQGKTGSFDLGLEADQQ